MYNHPSGEFVFAIFTALPVFLGTVSFRALSGGIGAEFSGGNFWQGAVTGGIVAGLNHVMHKVYPPDGFKGKEWKDEHGHFIRREDGGYDVQNNPENIGYYKEIESVMVRGKKASTTLIEKVDKAVTSIGIVSDYNESLLSKTGTSTKGYVKLLGRIGKATGIIGVGIAGYELYKNPTVGNFMKFGVSAGMVVIRTNPAVGVIVGISDITGFTDTLTGKIDNIIYKK